MIPITTLLAPLTPTEQKEFNALSAAYRDALKAIADHGNDARKARKQELREALKTAPANRLLSLSAELETMDGTYQTARKAAKSRLRDLNTRYSSLFTPILERCEARADELIQKVRREFRKHFAVVGAEPTGTSPAEDFLQRWKTDLVNKREGLKLFEDRHSAPQKPETVLPYPVTTDEQNPLS